MNEIVQLRTLSPVAVAPTESPAFAIYQVRPGGMVAIDACVPLAIAVEMLRLLSSAS